MISILSLIVLSLYFWVFIFLVNIKEYKCKCAITWKRDYIIGFIGFVFLLNLYLLLIDNINLKFSTIFMILLAFAAALNIVLMLQYAIDLRKERCNCVDQFSIDIMTFLAFFQIFTIIFSFIIALILSKK